MWNKTTVLFLGPGGKMTTKTLSQLVTQADLEERPESRAKALIKSATRFVYDSWATAPEAEKHHAAKIVAYTVLAYLAMC